MTRRSPAVAGLFYPEDPVVLAHRIDGLLAAVEVPPSRASHLVIAPHAGIVYSGLTAAYAYAALAPFQAHVRRVVVIGPSHRVYVEGVAVPTVDAFVTPLGAIPLDRERCHALTSLDGVVVDDEAHRREHSVEIHLPFLQRLLPGGFELVPLVVGRASAELVADVLEVALEGSETVGVVSSDLSHFLPYDEARACDAATAAAIERRAWRSLDGHKACGFHAVRGALLLAERHAWNVHTLDLRNSGDTAGRKAEVVGYGAWSIA